MPVALVKVTWQCCKRSLAAINTSDDEKLTSVYSPSKVASPPWVLHHGLGLGAIVGSGISALSLCHIRVEGQRTPRSDSPERQGPVHFISWPLANRGAPKCWTSECILQATQTALKLRLNLPSSLGPFPSQTFLSQWSLCALYYFQCRAKKWRYDSQSPGWPPVVSDSLTFMHSPLTLQLSQCDQ